MNNELITLSFQDVAVLDQIVSEIEKYSIDSQHKRAYTGLEIWTFVFTVGEFLIAMASIPILSSMIDESKAVLTFRGFEIRDKVSNIVKLLNQDHDLLQEVKKAYEERSIQMKGNAKNIEELQKKIEELIGDVNDG